MAGRRIAVVADDLTGSADTGVQFRRAGIAARVLLRLSADGGGGVAVYDTDSRALAPLSAARRVHRLGRALAAHGTDRVYKKIDSTVRGNVGAETVALLRALDLPLAVVAPAFPANGRTSCQGVQLVHGVPVHRTAAANDPAHPMRYPTIAAALAAQTAVPIENVTLDIVRAGVEPLGERLLAQAARGSPSIAIVDAETDADLATIAGALAAPALRCLPVGSAGLASHLPQAWAIPAAASVDEDRPPVARRVLFVCGSLNPVTLGQVALLEKALGDSSVAGAAGGAAAETASRLASGVAVVSSGQQRLDAAPKSVASRLARCVRVATRQTRPDGLVLTGGDIARAVLSTLEVQGIELVGEVLPGMPSGRLIGGALDGTSVLTKAGGFGPPEALVLALSYLRGENPARQEESAR